MPTHRRERVADPALLQVVLELIAEGLTNAAIGRRLCLSEEGVKNRVSSLLNHLGANGRTNAVALGYRRGLLKIPPTPHDGPRG